MFWRGKGERMEGVGRVTIDILPDGLKVRLSFPEVSEMDNEQARQAALAIGQALHNYSCGDGRALAHLQAAVGEECARTNYHKFGEIILRVLNALHEENLPVKPVVPATRVFAPPGD